jgi:hypothetical protein
MTGSTGQAFLHTYIKTSCINNWTDQDGDQWTLYMLIYQCPLHYKCICMWYLYLKPHLCTHKCICVWRKDRKIILRIKGTMHPVYIVIKMLPLWIGLGSDRIALCFQTVRFDRELLLRTQNSKPLKPQGLKPHLGFESISYLVDVHM